MTAPGGGRNTAETGHWRFTDAANEIAAEGEPVDPDDLATIAPYITHTVRRFGDWVINLTPPDQTPSTRLDLEPRVLFPGWSGLTTAARHPTVEPSGPQRYRPPQMGWWPCWRIPQASTLRTYHFFRPPGPRGRHGLVRRTSVTVVLPPRVSVLPLSHPAPLAPSGSFLSVTPRLVQPGAVVLLVRGEVDMASSPYLWEHVHGHVHYAGPDVIVDLTEVTFLGAAGLTILVNLREAAKLAEIRFSVIATALAILRLLSITGLDVVIDVYPDLDHTPMRSWPPIGLR